MVKVEHVLTAVCMSHGSSRALIDILSTCEESDENSSYKPSEKDFYPWHMELCTGHYMQSAAELKNLKQRIRFFFCFFFGCIVYNPSTKEAIKRLSLFLRDVPPH